MKNSMVYVGVGLESSGESIDAYPELQSLEDQIEVTTSGDDEGVEFQNQLSCLGELIAGADSYPTPIAFHCTTDNTSGTTITSATDITDIVQADSGSTTGFFGGTTAGSYILVGSTQVFEGAKNKYDTLATVEPDNVIAEYYSSSLSSWEEEPIMATDSSYPYSSSGNTIAVAESEQIFFGFDPLTRGVSTDWEEVTLNINGTDYTYFWARYRIISDITGDPIIQQIKLHTDRIELESTGIFKFGKARTRAHLPFEMVKNDNSDPASESVDYTPQYTADYVDNELVYTTTDGFGIIINRLPNLDTSVPLVVTISFYVKGTATGDIYLQYEVSQVSDGFVYDGAEDYDAYTLIETIDTSQNLTRFTIELPCPISKLSTDAGVVMNVYREGDNALDTLSASIIRTNVSVAGYTWRN